VRPTDTSAIITHGKDGVSFESGKWGFTRWDGKGVIINARAETITQKNTFSKHVDEGRCVVPAGKFFEWEKLETGKRKHYAKDAHGNMLFMAGLYRDVVNPELSSDTVREFVIITKQATGDMAKIHDRVPVILRIDQLDDWLSGKLLPKDIEKLEYEIEIAPCEAYETQTTMFG